MPMRVGSNLLDVSRTDAVHVTHLRGSGAAAERQLDHEWCSRRIGKVFTITGGGFVYERKARAASAHTE